MAHGSPAIYARPHLTKMARGDENDLEDIRFLLRHEELAGEPLRALFRRARVPEVPEIQELFRAAQGKVIAIADALRQVR